MAHDQPSDNMIEAQHVKEGVPIVSTTALLGEGLEKIEEHAHQALDEGVNLSDQTETSSSTLPHGVSASLQDDFISARNLTVPADAVEKPSQAAQAETEAGARPPAYTIEQHTDDGVSFDTDQYQSAGQYADEQNLEVDDDSSDSALGSDTESITISLNNSIFHHRREHGRTYHAYKDGKYIFPNDEQEADRLDLQHHLFGMTFNQKLFFSPIHEPKNVLDVGTGTGIWALDFADNHPECQVTGIDLSPGQPTLVSPNLRFLVDDAEDLWLYQNKFDLIHARLMAGCFADWPNFFRQAYQNLEPGGWLELQDYGLPVRSTDGTHLGTNIMRWSELLCEAARKMGRPMGSDACDLYMQQMHEAGFVDIQQRMFMWPSKPGLRIH